MIAKNITREQLEKAATEVGVSIDVTTQKGTRHRVKVNPSEYALRNANGDRPYQRISLNHHGRERRVAAVCWHGFRDYFRACFAQAPDAEFKTALDHWRGSEDFERRFPASGDRNIGSQVQPLLIVDACRCPDRGWAR